MKKLRQLAKQLMCVRLGHNYQFYPLYGTKNGEPIGGGRNNMFVCKRCGEPGWRV